MDKEDEWECNNCHKTNRRVSVCCEECHTVRERQCRRGWDKRHSIIVYQMKQNNVCCQCKYFYEMSNSCCPKCNHPECFACRNLHAQFLNKQ